MDINIRTKNLKATPAIREYVDKKVDRILRHFTSDGSVTVELISQDSHSQDQRAVAQLTLETGGLALRSEERAQNINAAIDAAVDVLVRRVRRYKGKYYRTERAKRAVRRGQTLQDRATDDLLLGDPLDDDVEPEGVVVKRKTFSVKPSSVDDAIFQMELLGHDFYLFLNSDTGAYNVLYRRRGGQYGLIETQPLTQPL